MGRYPAGGLAGSSLVIGYSHLWAKAEDRSRKDAEALVKAAAAGVAAPVRTLCGRWPS
jgi:hypothetical protein